MPTPLTVFEKFPEKYNKLFLPLFTVRLLHRSFCVSCVSNVFLVRINWSFCTFESRQLVFVASVCIIVLESWQLGSCGCSSYFPFHCVVIQFSNIFLLSEYDVKSLEFFSYYQLAFSDIFWGVRSVSVFQQCKGFQGIYCMEPHIDIITLLLVACILNSWCKCSLFAWGLDIAVKSKLFLINRYVVCLKPINFKHLLK